MSPARHLEPAVKAAMEVLLSRYSVGGKYLTEPAPTPDALRQMAEAALRAPDHAGLTPFRFAAVRGPARERLADLFEQAAVQAGKNAADAALDRGRALGMPLLVAVIARIDTGHPIATVHEQWITVGGALTNFLNAAHALGYGGKMLSGSKVRSAPVMQAFCGPGEQLVGWMVLGTPRKKGSPKFDKPGAADVMSDWP